MMYDRAGDEELMLRVADGNRDALNPLVRRHADSLLTFIQRMIGDRHRAEELFQEVFLAVWQRRRGYQYPRSFRAWLFGIAANKCRADYRSELRAPWTMSIAPADSELEPPANAAEPSPVEAAIATETATLVAQAVAMLPAQQRAVLVLKLWNGLDYAEIARSLGSAPGTVRSHMFHALNALRRYLEPRLRQSDDK
jgi:RNA polymerase sigma-70 factor (ECF subfamily)